MNTYEVAVEVDGVVIVTLTETDEETACKRARLLAELGEGVPNLTYEAVSVKVATS
jgi:hypothetical protein